jgi:uncharacterized protein (TIGR02246 family)
MSRSSFVAGATLLLSIAASAPPSFGADTGAQSLDAAWMKAMKANDLEAVMACYATDAVLWLPGAPEAKGEKAIRAAYQGLFNANTVRDVTMSENQYRTSEKLSSGWGRYTLTLAPKAGGAAVTMRGRFTEVVEQRAGRWVYVADHASDEPAVPTPPKK